MENGYNEYNIPNTLNNRFDDTEKKVIIGIFGVFLLCVLGIVLLRIRKGDSSTENYKAGDNQRILVISLMDDYKQDLEVLKSKGASFDLIEYSFFKEVTPQNWVEIAEKIASVTGKDSDPDNTYDAIIVLHPEQTICNTGSALSFMLENNRTPILLSDDAERSYFFSKKFSLPEVVILSAENVVRANRAKKIGDEVISPNYPVLVYKNRVNEKYVLEVNQPDSEKDHLTLNLLKIDPNLSVGVFKAHPGADLKGLKQPCDVLVIETYHDGYLEQIPNKALLGVKVPIIVVSQTGGKVEMTDKPVITCPVTLETAIAKLYVLFSNVPEIGNVKNREMLGKLMNTPMRGELD